MLLGLATATLVLGALVWELSRPMLSARCSRARTRARERGWFAHYSRRPHELDYDPGRERRAEQRARRLLRSCVNEREWAMYRDLGFLRVFGARGERYAYLIYPHKPIVAYVPCTSALLSEYCVAFPDHSRPYGSARLPDSDDVLAKWMALTADERGLIADANMHLPGRQVDPERVRRDLARLARWEREHANAPITGGADMAVRDERDRAALSEEDRAAFSELDMAMRGERDMAARGAHNRAVCGEQDLTASAVRDRAIRGQRDLPAAGSVRAA